MNQKQITEETISASINFPAIRLEGGFVTEITGFLSRASRLGLKGGNYRQAIVVDANGNKFRIIDVRKKRILFSWRFGALLELAAGNPALEVELIFGPPSKISLEEAKELLFKSFKRQSEYWNEMIDFDEFRAKIRRTESFDQMFSVLREFQIVT